ncbi:MAG: serine hydroxymethyltransferase, partial [Eubacteriales bacterium]|nr:serine hydroxymethyltransferase [Eubacteriales bacterium]
EVGAYLMVDMAHIAGLISSGVHPSPVPYADVVTTTTHKTLRGPRGGIILAKKEYGKAIDKAIFPGTQGGPLMHIIAAKAVAFQEALQPSFRVYQQNVVNNAHTLGESLNKHGVNLVSGGTDTHLLLLNLRGTGCTGKELQHRLDEVNITTNMNTVPYETEKATVTSGLRVGTPALTTRGFGKEEMELLGELISLAIFKYDESKDRILKEVADLCEKFPLYADLK